MSANTPAPAPKAPTTREEWLQRAIELLRPMFVQVGAPLPEKVYVSVGFGGAGGRYEKKVLGVCYKRRVSEDGANQIFISPTLGDTAHVLDVLIHQLIHASDDGESGHRGHFAETATRLGLTGSMTATVADISLTAELMVMAAEIGEYPHSVMSIPARTKVTPGVPVPAGPGGTISSAPGPQKNRWISFQCPDHRVPVRMSRTRAAQGAPLCGHDQEGVPCGKRMQER